MATTKFTLRVPSIGYKKPIELDVKPIPVLEITNKIIGYTCQHIYGRLNDLDYESIVVPVYRMNLRESLKGKILKEYGVTRDSWYSRGITKSFLWLDDIELSNRCFEPREKDINLYSTVPLEYPPNSGLNAFALRQKNTEKLNAEIHTKKINTHVDNSKIDGARKDLDIAKGVMIHIGGYYYHKGKNINKLAGSYGCFGFIPNHQMGTISKMEEWRKNRTYSNKETSNEEYEKFIDEVIKVRGKGKLRVLIHKRENNEKHKILENQ